MFDAEFHAGHPRPEVELVEGVVVVAFFQEGTVGGFGEVGLVVEQVQDTDGLLGDQVDDGLIVRVADVLPLDLLLGVFLLFQLENVLVEVEL